MKFLNSAGVGLLIVCFSAFAAPAFGKDLTQRLGIGFKNNTSQSLPSLAGVYYAAKDFAFTGGFGINTEKNNSTYQVHVGARKIIFTENNLNFYTGVQFGLASYESVIDGRNSGVEALAVFGAEFFFAGLDSLAFTFEAGAGVSSANYTRFRTVGDDPFRAGVIFYF